MGIASFSRNTVIDYVPAYGGNRKSKEPCVIGLRFASVEKVHEYRRVLAAETRHMRNPEEIAEASQAMQKKEVLENIEFIKGFYVDGQEVTGKEDFYRHASSALIEEIAMAIESSAILTEGQRKNS